MSATNSYHHALPERSVDSAQLSPAWHTLCLNHEAYRDELLAQAREVLRTYETPGLFFDIILTPDCVCAACLATMDEMGLDPGEAGRPAEERRVGQRAFPQRDERRAAGGISGRSHLLQLRPHP